MIRVAPLPGETTSSLICRVAAAYGLEATALLTCWRWRNHRPRHPGSGPRADAEVMLDDPGRRVLAGLCGVSEKVLERALPAWGREEDKLADREDEPQALWRAGGTVAGPVAFGCRLCAARRTGAPARWLRYAERWERVCVRHARWALDADADQPLEHLDLRALPEVVAAQRRWARVARRAVRAGVEPGEVFDLAHAVVCRWWDHALHWEQERIWPRRLHAVAGGNAGTDLGRWRVVGWDPVIFPEVVAVAGALLDPVMAELVWADSGGGQPRPLPADGAFCARLGRAVGREWLGPLAAVDYGGPLLAWMGSVIRERRHPGPPPGYPDNPWWVQREHQPATMASQLRVLAKEKKAGGSGTKWRSVVPGEQRALITSRIRDAEEQLVQLRGAQNGATADAARHLLRSLSHAIGLLDDALRETAAAARDAGVPLEDLARWAGLPPRALAEEIEAYRADVDGYAR